MWRAIFGPKALALSLIAVLAMTLCVSLGNWQWGRKITRDQVNQILTSNLKRPPVQLAEVMRVGHSPAESDRWRRVQVSGQYQVGTSYLRGRSYQGKYGFAVLSRFKTEKGMLWVDRGWIAAPGDATEAPIAPEPPVGMVRLVGRVRDLTSKDNPGLGGALFGLPFKKPVSVADFVANQHSDDPTLDGYIELVSSSPSGTDQPVPLNTPTITPGPHLAYAVQWYLFALLFLFGRILIGRDDYRRQQKANRQLQRSAN